MNVYVALVETLPPLTFPMWPQPCLSSNNVELFLAGNLISVWYFKKKIAHRRLWELTRPKQNGGLILLILTWMTPWIFLDLPNHGCQHPFRQQFTSFMTEWATCIWLFFMTDTNIKNICSFVLSMMENNWWCIEGRDWLILVYASFHLVLSWTWQDTAAMAVIPPWGLQLVINKQLLADIVLSIRTEPICTCTKKLVPLEFIWVWRLISDMKAHMSELHQSHENDNVQRGHGCLSESYYGDSVYRPGHEIYNLNSSAALRVVERVHNSRVKH